MNSSSSHFASEPSESSSFLKQLTPEQRPRALRILEAFLQALERNGYADAEQWLAADPDLATVLRPYLAKLDELHRAAEMIRGDPSSAGTDDEPTTSHRRLGDYRIVREVGRGGMGVVYEAEQLSLARRVALKVLPYAAVLDQRAAQRFKNEALAAAALDHAHIVDLYGIGCERGVHFFAMRYVDGLTLADCIRSLRQASRHGGNMRYESLAAVVADSTARDAGRAPGSTAEASTVLYTPGIAPSGRPVALRDATVGDETSATRLRSGPLGRLAPLRVRPRRRSFHSPAFFRAMAVLGAQVAEALDHAHEQGVIHRDVKPSNLILDRHGQPWVADFGLAQVGTDAALTATGELLGTLRYMSPEQSLAQRVGVDHRTDIYSLGVTLYELLVLRAAFPSRNRQDLLRQISTEEPPAPRNLNPAVPADLETVVLKAMSKDPSDRYPTAREMAADLRRFAENRTVVARRPGIAKRIGKWTQRHRTPVLSAAAVAILACAVMAGAVALIWRQNLDLRASIESGREARERADTNWRQSLTLLNDVQDLLRDPSFKSIDPELSRRIFSLLSDYVAGLSQVNDSPADVEYELCEVRLTATAFTIGSDLAYARQQLDALLESCERLLVDAPHDSKLPVILAHALTLEGMYWVQMATNSRTAGDAAAAQETSSFERHAISPVSGQDASSQRLAALVDRLHAECKRFPDSADLYDALCGVQYMEYSVLSDARSERAEATADEWVALVMAERHEPLLAEYVGRGSGLLSAAEMTARAGRLDAYESLLWRAVREDERRTAAESLASSPPIFISARRRLVEYLLSADRREDARTVATDAGRRLEALLPAWPAGRRTGNAVGWLMHCSSMMNSVGDTKEAMRYQEMAWTYAHEQMQHETQELFWTITPRAYDIAQPLNATLRSRQDFPRAETVARQGWLDAECEFLCRFARRDDMERPFGSEAPRGMRRHIVSLRSQLVLARLLNENAQAGDTGSPRTLRDRILNSPLTGLTPLVHAFADEWSSPVEWAVIENDLAWQLATLDAQHRDPELARHLACAAVDRQPEVAGFRNTLGVAEYRAGDLAAAVGALNDSCRMSGGGSSHDHFFLAMAHWQLGHEDEARAWHRRGVEWMLIHASQNPELIRFRDEAESLLGWALPVREDLPRDGLPSREDGRASQ
jgi:serine/threonine protein kinase